MIWVFFFVWAVTFVALLWYAYRLDRAETARRLEKSRTHALCISAIFSQIGDAHAANVLRAAADRWDSIEEQPNLRRLANERYSAGGPSMPAIWLRTEADRLAPQDKEVNA